MVFSPTASAILFTCLGYGIFTLTDALAKLLSGGYPVMVIIFLQSIVGLTCIVSYCLIRVGPKCFRTQHICWHLLRGLFSGCTGMLNVNALRSLQLDEFYAVIFMAPLIVVLSVTIILRERLGMRRLVAIIFGFVCVLYMIQPGKSLFQIGALFAFCSTVLYALSCVIVRVIGQKDSVLLFTVFALLGGFVVSGINLLIVQENIVQYLSYPDVWLVAVNGVLVSFGALFVTLGLQKAPITASVAPFHYTQMIWGVLLGFVMFGDLPTNTVMIGATGLIATGLYLVLYEAQETRRQKKATPVI